MILAVVGSRSCTRTQFTRIIRHLEALDPMPDQIVTGDATGADEAARWWSHYGSGLASSAIVCVADRLPNGQFADKGAGPRRNVEIVKIADALLAFRCNPISKGTDNVIGLARRKGIPVTEVDLREAG